MKITHFWPQARWDSQLWKAIEMAWKQENKRHDIEISTGSAPGFILQATVGFDRSTEMAALVVSSVGAQTDFLFTAGDPVTFPIPITGWYRLQSAARINRAAADALILGVGICAGTPSFANLIAHKRRWMPSGGGGSQHVATTCSTEYYFTEGDTASLVAFSLVGPAYVSPSEPISVSCRLIV